jgi:hypothetical protein
LSAHRTRAEIGEDLTPTSPLRLSERHVPNLMDVSRAVRRASQQDPREGLARTVQTPGGLVLSLEGLPPEQGHAQLWLGRAVLRGMILGGEKRRSAAAAVLADLLRPLAHLGLPVVGVLSDAHEAIREAVPTVFPAVPPHICPYHALGEAGRPLFEIDRPRAVPGRQELGGMREIAPPVEPEPANDPPREVVQDSLLAMQPVTRTPGILPCELAGRRLRDALHALGASLDRCREKGRIVGCTTYA